MGPQGNINHLLPTTAAKGGLIAPIKNLQIRRVEKFHQGLPSTIAVGATPCGVMCIGVTPHN